VIVVRLTSHARACGGLEHAAALSHEQLDEALEGMPSLEPEELEDVLGPVGVDPLLEVMLRGLLGEEERREATVKQPMGQILVAEVDEVGERHRRQPHLGLPASERVAEPGRGERRVGKSVLCQSLPDCEYFYCELPRVRRLLEDPEGFLRQHRGKRIVLDEVHRLPNPAEILNAGDPRCPRDHATSIAFG